TRSHAEYIEGDSLQEMIREDLIAERVAIQSYAEIVRWLGTGAPTTRRLMEEILAKEEEHADDLLDLLDGPAGSAIAVIRRPHRRLISASHCHTGVSQCSCVRGLRPLLPSRAVERCSVRRLVCHRRFDDQDLLPAELPCAAAVGRNRMFLAYS